MLGHAPSPPLGARGVESPHLMTTPGYAMLAVWDPPPLLAPPRDMAAPPLNVEAPPHNMEAPPHNMAAPHLSSLVQWHRSITPPYRKAPSTGIHTPQLCRGARNTSRRGIVMKPHPNLMRCPPNQVPRPLNPVP